MDAGLGPGAGRGGADPAPRPGSVGSGSIDSVVPPADGGHQGERERLGAGGPDAVGPSARVLGPHGEPVEGALVFAGWPWATGSAAPARTTPLAETDASGYAAFSAADCHRIDGMIQLVALHPDWGAAWGAFRDLGSVSQLVMGEPREANVEVRNLADVPVSGPLSLGLAPTRESLLVAPDGGANPPWIRRHVQQIAGTAQLRIRGLPAVGMPLLVGAEGYASAAAWVVPNAEARMGGGAEASADGNPVPFRGDGRFQVVRLGAERLVEFRVTSGEQPCADVGVQIFGPSKGHGLAWCYAAGVTDASGRVSLASPEPPPGMTVPVFAAEGAGYKGVTDSITEDELRRGWKAVDMGEKSAANGTLRAELIDSEGRPARLGASAIRLDKYGFGARTSGSFLGHRDADRAGIVEFTGLPTGVPVGLRIEPRAGVNSGVIAAHTEPMLASGEVRSVVVRVGELVLVRGTVHVDGKPSPGTIFGTTESRLGKKYGQFSVEAGPAGTFEVSLPPAVYQLHAMLGESIHKPEVQVLELAPGSASREVSIDFSAQRKAPLRGRLLDGAGKGIAHRSVLIRNHSATSAGTTDASGRFELESIDLDFAGLWVASRDGRLWSMGRASLLEQRPGEFEDLVFNERPVLLTVVDGDGNPVCVSGQSVSMGRPSKLVGPRVSQRPLLTDPRGSIGLWIPSGEHTIAAPVQGKTFLIPQGAGAPNAPLSIDVRDETRVRYGWQRPVEAQGEGRVVVTRIGESEPFRVTLGAQAGTEKMLYLARGRYELAFEAKSGARTLETIDLTSR